jgi:hypothetical protein
VRRHAWLAALLTIFTPFYFPYWGVPESFAPFAVFGALALYWGSMEARWQCALAGMCAGLAHLSRADGALLLLPLILVNLRVSRQSLRSIVIILLGYGLVLLPWFIRNLNVIGSPLSSAGTQAVWMCNYDELFSYDAQFDVNHLLNCRNLIGARVSGVASGAVHWLAEAGMIFLAPLIVLGLWRERRAPPFRAALWYGGLLFVAMTLVFTFAGDRGGLFHSTSALLPFCYAAAPIGLDAIIDWIAYRRRTWNAARAKSIFSVALVTYALVLSFFIYRGRVLGPDAADPIWNQSDRVYETIGQWLRDRGEVDPIVMVNNPPGFTYQTGLRSIVVPYGSGIDLLKAAHQFGARWVALDPHRPDALAEWYHDPQQAQGLRLRQEFGPVKLFEVQNQGQSE